MNDNLATKEILIAKEVVYQKIDSLIQNLTEINDEDGQYLLNFDGVVVDDKSWNVWNWPQGVGLYGLYKYYRMTGDQKAYRIIIEWFDRQFLRGAPPKNVNTMAPLLTMAFIFEENNDLRYLAYLEDWCNWVMYDMPRTQEAGLEHLTYGPENIEQLWDDTLMMTVLPLAKIGILLKRPEYVEEAKRQFILHTKYLADKITGLWYHGWNFEKRHNYAEALWARGNCWITIAIPEIIEILELDKGDGFRMYLEETLLSQVKALADYQHENGLWHTLINDSETYLESSASAGFVYGILKSVNKRYIDKSYLPIAEKGIQGLMSEIADNGAVQNVSIGTGMGDSLDFYKQIGITEMPYGQSLTILAFSEFLHHYI